jgi:hypothetical protein
MKQLLEVPVEFGDARLAPTTELAGLAELANLHFQSERVAALVRIARTIADEDLARAAVTDQRAAARSGLVVLPQRGH